MEEASFSLCLHLMHSSVSFLCGGHTLFHIVPHSFAVILFQLLNCCLCQPSIPSLHWLSIFKLCGGALELIKSFAKPLLDMAYTV